MIEFEHVTTRGGDRGESSLFNGERLRKDDLVFTTLGDIDELSSAIGVARAILRREYPREKRLHKLFESIQRDLIRVGGQVATPERDQLYKKLDHIDADDVERLEKAERSYMQSVKMPERFVLPGDTEAGGFIDLSRSVCRRAERGVVACIRERHMAKLYACQHYLNRLSDLLFVAARWVEQRKAT
jgi:cob(I)alamin adenosyltransferase